MQHHTETDTMEWERLMMSNARLDFSDADRVARELRHIGRAGDPNEPSVRHGLMCVLRTTSVSCGPPEDWPQDRDEDEFFLDGAGGRCPIYTDDCDTIMRHVHGLLNLAPAENAIERRLAVHATGGPYVHFGTNHASDLGIRPRGAPDVREHPRPVSELGEGILYKLFGDHVFRAAYYCPCNDPRATAELVLAAHEPNGGWFVMRCGDTVHAWKLHGDTQPQTIFDVGDAAGFVASFGVGR